MSKHKAVIWGAGRIGAGYKWIDTPYIYCHADTYLALKDRVELLGFVEPDPERAEAARKKYGLSVWTEVPDVEFDIASVCTPPSERLKVFNDLIAAGVKGIYCEKPYGMRFIPPVYTQINFIRRGERIHRSLEEISVGHLTVWAKKDIHTACHFADLARFWGLNKSQLTYNAIDGPNHYEWEYESATPLNPNTKIAFIGGGLTPGFMEFMLGNLLDAVEGKAKLVSPASSAIESEEWANEILES